MFTASIPLLVCYYAILFFAGYGVISVFRHLPKALDSLGRWRARRAERMRKSHCKEDSSMVE